MSQITKIYCPGNGDAVSEIMDMYGGNAQITDGVVLTKIADSTHNTAINIIGSSKDVNQYFATFCEVYGLSQCPKGS